MIVKQLSIMLPNRLGALSSISAVLARENINLRALCIADTSEYGIMRVIVDNVDAVSALLLREGYICTVTDVLAVAIENHSGALAQKVALLADNGIGVEYAYAFTSSVPNAAYAVFRVDDIARANTIVGNGEVRF